MKRIKFKLSIAKRGLQPWKWPNCFWRVGVKFSYPSTGISANDEGIASDSFLVHRHPSITCWQRNRKSMISCTVNRSHPYALSKWSNFCRTECDLHVCNNGGYWILGIKALKTTIWVEARWMELRGDVFTGVRFVCGFNSWALIWMVLDWTP